MHSYLEVVQRVKTGCIRKFNRKEVPVGGRQGEEVQNVDGQEHEDHQAEVDQAEVDQAEVDQDEEQDEQEAEGAAVDDSDEFPEDWIHLNF